MATIGLILLTMFITGYCLYHAIINFKEKNKLGGTAISLLGILSLVSPFLLLYYK